MPPRTEHLVSESATFQRFDALRRNRNQRHRQRTFFVEGVRQIDQLLAHGWTVRSFLYPSDVARSSWAEGLLASSDAEIHYALPSRLHRKLSGKNDASELFALVAMPEDDLDRIPSDVDMPLIVVVDRAGSPGNLGTLIRSCDALGVDGVVMSGHAVDLYDPETIAATTGSLFALPVVRTASQRELLPLLDRIRSRHGDLQLVGTSAHATRAVDACSFWRPTVLLIGNEAKGLSQAYQEIADVTVSIPMQGSATSLNVACAASILLYEVQRQRAR
jgi:TrmH family RNA methyltransferase